MNLRTKSLLFFGTVLLGLATACDRFKKTVTSPESVTGEPSPDPSPDALTMQTKLSVVQVTQIALKYAQAHPNLAFRNPYVESAAQSIRDGHWVVRVFSKKPTPDLPGVFMSLTIDKSTGDVLIVE